MLLEVLMAVCVYAGLGLRCRGSPKRGCTRRRQPRVAAADREEVAQPTSDQPTSIMEEREEVA